MPDRRTLATGLRTGLTTYWIRCNTVKSPADWEGDILMVYIRCHILIILLYSLCYTRLYCITLLYFVLLLDSLIFFYSVVHFLTLWNIFNGVVLCSIMLHCLIL